MANRYNGLHRNQLFHWIGSHIERPPPGSTGRPARQLDDAQRAQYLDCLRTVLSPRAGLWMKVPSVPDQLGDGSLIRVQQPIVCFTEWSLDQSLPHTLRYGRLGLGFSKQFVLQCGGQPVTYVRDRARRDPFTRSMMTIARHLRDSDDRELAAAFQYVSHFLKRIDRAEPPRAPKARRSKATTSRARKKPPATKDEFKRPFGRTLEFLEEREWRVVWNEWIADRFVANRGTPPYYLRIRPGLDLFTLALPDNRTVNMALQDRKLRSLLLPRAAPHVTVLSLEDVGTF
jgi:abortive phage resistance protein AbiGi (putative antitoxin)